MAFLAKFPFLPEIVEQNVPNPNVKSWGWDCDINSHCTLTIEAIVCIVIIILIIIGIICGLISYLTSCCDFFCQSVQESNTTGMELVEQSQVNPCLEIPSTSDRTSEATTDLL